MSQVIIYTNSNGGVSVCVPTGELPIETVLTKDCPAGAIIVDDSTLPQGDDALFFDAWKLNGTTVTVDFPTAQAHFLTRYNAAAVSAGQTRQNNTYAGIANTTSDADWQAKVAAGRAAIASATTTAGLAAIALPQSE